MGAVSTRHRIDIRLERQQILEVDENQRFYERSSTAAHYASRSALHIDEGEILRRLEREIAGRRILDMGVGGGRTTPYLLELSRSYVGVDYSREMISRCRRKFPGVQFEVADARDLSVFTNDSFDVVLFSNNGIDAVSHEGRLLILSELRRVLSDGGILIFSSHNQNFRTPKPWDPRHAAINPLVHPMRFAKRIAAMFIGVANYGRRVRHGKVEAEYRIIIDSAHRYSLTHYTITPMMQIRQLQQLGFHDVELVDNHGQRLCEREAETTREPWIYYLCRKTEPKQL